MANSRPLPTGGICLSHSLRLDNDSLPPHRLCSAHANVSGRSQPQEGDFNEIATSFDIPANHLIKIVNELARRGYVRTIRGPGGGVELARKAKEISLGEVIEDLQGPLRLHNCVAGSGTCAIEAICRLRGILRQADEAQARFLNRFTLADIIPVAPNREQDSFDPAI